MADSKTYTIAGTSSKDGVNTYRFATGKATVRAGVLKRNGHTDIALRDLPSPMTKDDAVAYLQKEGIAAVVPKSGRKAAAVKSPEEIAAEAEAAKKAAANERRKAARKAAKTANVTEADKEFVEGSAESLINTLPNVEEINEFPVDIPQESVAAAA